MDPSLFLVFSLLFHNYYYATLGLLGLWGLYSFKRKKHFLFAVFVAVVLAFALKSFYAEPRPCALVDGLVGCPPTEGFPSIHSAFAALLAIGSLGSILFFVFAPLAFLIIYSRVFLGVHSVDQVFAGFALGLIVYLVAWRFFEPSHRKGSEPLRKFAHVGGGLILLLVGVFFGRQALLFSSVFALSYGLVLSQAVLRGLVPKRFLAFFEKLSGGENPPASGGIGFFAGVLLLFTFAHSDAFAFGVLAILTIGDGLAAFVGKNGKHLLPWNEKKTLEGFLAFSIFGAGAAYFFLGPVSSLFYAILLGFIETLDVQVDDNILIPVSALSLKVLGV